MRFNRAENPEEKAEALGSPARILGGARYEGLDELKRTFSLWLAYNLQRDKIPGDWREPLENNDFEEVGMLYAQGFRKWENNVRDKGRAEGRKEGRAEGELKNQRKNLREILAKKFGASLPSWLAAETDLERLRRLTMAAACADSMAAFAAQMEAERAS